MSGTGMRQKSSTFQGHRERTEGKREKKQHAFEEGKGLSKELPLLVIN